MADDWSEDIQTELVVGDLTSGFIDVTSNVPPELLAFYGSAPHEITVVKALIKFVIPSKLQPGKFAYYYMIAGTTPSELNVMEAQGWVDFSGTVRELWASLGPAGTPFTPIVNYGTNSAVEYTWGNFINNPRFFATWANGEHQISGTWNYNLNDGFNPGTVTYNMAGATPGTLIYNLDPNGVINYNTGMGGDVRFDGRSAPRVLVDWGFTTTTVTLPAGPTFAQIIQSQFQETFRDGRAFHITVHYNNSVGVAGDFGGIQIKQGSNGTTLRAAQNIIFPATTNQISGIDEWYFVNTSGQDILDFISVQCNVHSATDTTGTAGASVNVPLWFTVFDVGSAAQFPWAKSLVP